MSAINTQILADPDSCRSGADYLKRLADANHDAATAAHRARSVSESGWQGEASEAFRDLVLRNARDIDELVRVTHRTERALRSFADSIETCRSRMADARRAAAEAGLMVTGWWIHKPNGADTSLPSDGKGSTSLPGLDPKHDAKERKEHQLQAWREADGLVGWARRLERTAHQDLNKVLDDTNNTVASLSKRTMWIGNAMAYAGAVHGAATKLQSMANDQLGFVEEFKRVSADSGLSVAKREERITQLMANYGLAQRQASSNAGALANLGSTKVGNAVFNPLSKTLGGTKEGLGRSLGRNVGLPGLLLTAADSGRQIIVDGEPIGKTVAVNFKGFGWGAAATGVTGVLLAGLGAGTAPATVLAVGVGATVTWGYGYAQENTWEDFRHDAGEAAGNALETYGKSVDAANEVERKHPGSMPLSKW